MTWNLLVDDLTVRAGKKLWALVRLKELGADIQQLVLVYTTRVRPILEYCAPVFNGALTYNQSMSLELVQKKALAIILGNRYPGTLRT